MADILKSNKDFSRLMKQLFVKYGCYSSVPPEMQLFLLVTTTAYICKTKNQNKEQITQFLNTPI